MVAKHRVLIVDDDADIRSAVRELLAGVGLLVVGEGSTGEEAIRLSQDLQPNLVVLDDRMPILTGRQALPEIRRVSPGVKILLFSATAAAADGNDGTIVLAKGTHPSQLLSVIATLLDSSD